MTYEFITTIQSDISPIKAHHMYSLWAQLPAAARVQVQLRYFEGQLGCCICRTCRSDCKASGFKHEPYRRFLRQQRAARKRRRGWP